MPDARHLRLGLFACLIMAATGVQMAGAQVAPTRSDYSEAVSIILEQTTYWRDKSEWDKAANALHRLLAFDPANADALLLQAKISLDMNRPGDAAKAVDSFKASHPADTRIAGVEAALRRGPISQETVDQARALAKAGQTAEAVAAFERAFGGAVPPPGYATEYFMLAAQTRGTDFARNGLADQVRDDPQKLDAQMIYAKFLTYTEATRAEGITRLRRLQQIPDVSKAADLALRQVLFWLPVHPDSVREIRQYLERFPQDIEIASVAAAIEADPALARIAGFSALDAGRLDAAGDKFAQSIKSNGNDSASLMGMGLVRMRQKRVDEGRTLLRQAIAIDPSLQASLADTLRTTATSQGRSSDYARLGQRIRALDMAVTAVSDKAKYGQTERTTPLAARAPAADQPLTFADAQTRLSNLAPAKSLSRAVPAPGGPKHRTVLAVESRPG